MSKQQDPMGFGKFVPGFDFLQKLAQGGTASLASWVAPTMDAEALDKRIGELKAVQFWLDQNAAALKATIQALEVQKMTLATLRSMNVPMPGATMPWPTPGASKADAASSPSAQAAATSTRPASPAASQEAPPARKSASRARAKPAAAVPDPMQFWGALTQQFQQIAGQALNDVAERTKQAASTTASNATATPAKKAAARSRKRA